jgi:hypothetical protein
MSFFRRAGWPPGPILKAKPWYPALGSARTFTPGSRRRDAAGEDPVRHVQLTVPEPVDRVLALEPEVDDDPVEIRPVGPPVARIAHERQLATSLPGLEQEGTAPDRPACLRVVDPVAPDLRQVFAAEHMRGEDVREQPSPAGKAGAEDDLDRLRIDSADTTDVSVVLLELPQPCTPGHPSPVREDEVPGRDRHIVAPARRAPDVVGEREGRLLRTLDA